MKLLFTIQQCIINVDFEISASWLAGELTCRQVGYSTTWRVANLAFGYFSCRRFGYVDKLEWRWVACRWVT